MSDSPSLEELLEIQERFGLPSPALVEKDWHVVKALAAVAAADPGPFKLVFGGGTALSRAHGLTKRMSEDIDLRIVADKASRPDLGRLRTNITDALLATGFKFDPDNKAQRNSMHENRYTIYQLPYDAISKGTGVLRPEIKIETAFFPLRRAAIDRPVSSFIAEGYGRPPELAAIACSTIAETAAEKFVALTRRAGAELSDLRDKHDPTLVRHIYDLHVTRGQYDSADVAALAREVMIADVETYGKHFPAYRDNPIAETLKAIEGIAASAKFANEFKNFLRDMVYGDRPDFNAAVTTLKSLGQHLQKTKA